MSDQRDDGCRCGECFGIHSEFISRFGKWPSMTHREGQDLKHRRESNEASWAAAAEEKMLDDVAQHEIWLGTEGADHLFENGHGE